MLVSVGEPLAAPTGLRRMAWASVWADVSVGTRLESRSLQVFDFVLMGLEATVSEPGYEPGSLSYLDA